MMTEIKKVEMHRYITEEWPFPKTIMVKDIELELKRVETEHSLSGSPMVCGVVDDSVFEEDTVYYAYDNDTYDFNIIIDTSLIGYSCYMIATSYGFVIDTVVSGCDKLEENLDRLIMALEESIE